MESNLYIIASGWRIFMVKYFIGNCKVHDIQVVQASNTFWNIMDN